MQRYTPPQKKKNPGEEKTETSYSCKQQVGLTDGQWTPYIHTQTHTYTAATLCGLQLPPSRPTTISWEDLYICVCLCARRRSRRCEGLSQRLVSGLLIQQDEGPMGLWEMIVGVWCLCVCIINGGVFYRRALSGPLNPLPLSFLKWRWAP